jgi:hypothetical protein
VGDQIGDNGGGFGAETDEGMLDVTALLPPVDENHSPMKEREVVVVTALRQEITKAEWNLGSDGRDQEEPQQTTRTKPTEERKALSGAWNSRGQGGVILLM